MARCRLRDEVRRVDKVRAMTRCSAQNIIKHGDIIECCRRKDHNGQHYALAKDLFGNFEQWVWGPAPKIRFYKERGGKMVEVTP